MINRLKKVLTAERPEPPEFCIFLCTACAVMREKGRIKKCPKCKSDKAVALRLIKEPGVTTPRLAMQWWCDQIQKEAESKADLIVRLGCPKNGNNRCHEIGCAERAISCYLMKGEHPERAGETVNYRLDLCEAHSHKFDKKPDKNWEGIKGKIVYRGPDF
jgi:hypothetical protein